LPPFFDPIFSSTAYEIQIQSSSHSSWHGCPPRLPRTGIDAGVRAQ
jgi:hypothetical protein